MARTRALNAPPNALSLSRMRYLGAVSQGNDSVIWRASHSAAAAVDGLVARTVFPTIPPHVDYELTKLGHSLLEPVCRLGLWARQNRAAIQPARRQFDAAKAGD
jgi:HxlR-like helix-turn-helix